MATGATARNSIKKVAETHNLISTSYHEAGHVIYGLLHFLYIEDAYLIQDEGGSISGFTDFNSFDIDNYYSDERLHKYLIRSEIGMWYSGQIAEKIHYKNNSGSNTFPSFFREGSSDDTNSASKLIRKYRMAPPGRPRYKLKQKILKEVELELEDNWKDVILIAHALFEKKRVSFDKIKELLVENSERLSFWKEQLPEIFRIHEDNSSLDEKELKIILKKFGQV